MTTRSSPFIVAEKSREKAMGGGSSRSETRVNGGLVEITG
jgi:hypothetical protein